uniref:Uncharacterized protein n=1 Tax=Plectus sambesii TaxID=2011161 RepID=A0A914WKM4_9BILA
MIRSSPSAKRRHPTARREASARLFHDCHGRHASRRVPSESGAKCESDDDAKTTAPTPNHSCIVCGCASITTRSGLRVDSEWTVRRTNERTDASRGSDRCLLARQLRPPSNRSGRLLKRLALHGAQTPNQQSMDKVCTKRAPMPAGRRTRREGISAEACTSVFVRIDDMCAQRAPGQATLSWSSAQLRSTAFYCI